MAWYDAGQRDAVLTAVTSTPYSFVSTLDPVRTWHVIDRRLWGTQGRDGSLGPEVIANGSFDADASWTKGAGWGISGGKAQCTSTGLTNLSQTMSGAVAGRWYRVNIAVESISGGSIRVLVGSSATNVTFDAPGVYSCVVRSSGAMTLFIQAPVSGVSVVIDDVSVREIVNAGNVASNNTTLGRPKLRPGGWLLFEGSEVLTASFPDIVGNNCTVAYSTLSGVFFLTGQNIGTSYDLPTSDWFECLVINRAIDASEQAALTAYLSNTVDRRIRNMMAVYGDSMAAGATSGSAFNRWHSRLQTLFNQRQDVYCAAVGGNTAQQMADIFTADSVYDKSIQIFWDKRNTGETQEAWLSAIAECVSHQKSGRFLILGTTNGNQNTERAPGADYQVVVGINAALASTYPDNYFDIRAYLIHDGLADAGITPTAQDLLDIADDVIPQSLRGDNVHINGIGQALVAQKVYEFIAGKGWLS